MTPTAALPASPRTRGLGRGDAALVLFGVALALLGLSTLAAFGRWIYSASEPCFSQTLLAACAAPTYQVSARVLSWAEVAPLMAATLFPVVSVIDPRRVYALLGGASVGTVAAFTVVWVEIPRPPGSAVWVWSGTTVSVAAYVGVILVLAGTALVMYGYLDAAWARAFRQRSARSVGRDRQDRAPGAPRR